MLNELGMVAYVPASCGSEVGGLQEWGQCGQPSESLSPKMKNKQASNVCDILYVLSNVLPLSYKTPITSLIGSKLDVTSPMISEKRTELAQEIQLSLPRPNS